MLQKAQKATFLATLFIKYNYLTPTASKDLLTALTSGELAPYRSAADWMSAARAWLKVEEAVK